MIGVSNLTKRFAGCVAVDGLSFEVARGEIVGFLGPNGAGKTTTMRILACFLPATSGEVRIAGLDAFSQSLEVRRRIGYMPENVPLYPEMRVGEYLRFRGRLKGLSGRALRIRGEEVCEMCGLDGMERRILGNLSKGYRQRVGLADALLHKPDLLILDEPTIGLDPNQIRQVRQLIRDLAAFHTVLLSTHILPEVEMTCQRVIIIDRGRIVAQDSPSALRGRFLGNAEVHAQVRAPAAEVEAALADWPGLLKWSAHPDGDWLNLTLECAPDTDLRERVFALAASRGWSLRELRMDRRSLEDVFVALTHAEDGGEGSV